MHDALLDFIDLWSPVAKVQNIDTEVYKLCCNNFYG